jgi:hypothetical protein
MHDEITMLHHIQLHVSSVNVCHTMCTVGVFVCVLGGMVGS